VPVEQHPDEQCERVAAEQLVGRGGLGDAKVGTLPILLHP
jgi:hypothetical protein